MLSTQLGLVILGGAAGSADEMSGAPDVDGVYGPIDALLNEVARQVMTGDDRRPGNTSSSD